MQKPSMRKWKEGRRAGRGGEEKRRKRGGGRRGGGERGRSCVVTGQVKRSFLTPDTSLITVHHN
jgi:hypothetical protein